VTWLIYMCDMTHSYVWHDSFICVTWLIHMCDMTHSYVWHDSCNALSASNTIAIWFLRVTWLFHMCWWTHSYVWHDSLIWLIYMWNASFTYDMSHSYIPYSFCSSRLDYLPGCAFTLEYLIHSCDWFICLINMWHDSFMWLVYMWHVSFIP